MSRGAGNSARENGVLTRRKVLAGLLFLALLLGVAFLLHWLQADHGFSVAGKHLGRGAYLVIFLAVFGDAIFPVFPSETSLIAASTLAAHGSLDLGLVILVGAAGSITGDSTLYWVARRGSRRLGRRLEQAHSRTTIEAALDVLGENGPVVLVCGRYVPGVRFVVNASMGFAHHAYRHFLVWSAVGGALWTTSICALAYAVATALPGFPLASVVISGALTIGAILVGFVLMRGSGWWRFRASLRQRLESES
jgi:membrane protein DedA with SNARE-associated domain